MPELHYRGNHHPWLERKSEVEWRGNPYTSEAVSDMMLRLIEMGLVKKP